MAMWDVHCVPREAMKYENSRSRAHVQENDYIYRESEMEKRVSQIRSKRRLKKESTNCTICISRDMTNTEALSVDEE